MSEPSESKGMAGKLITAVVTIVLASVAGGGASMAVIESKVERVEKVLDINTQEDQDTREDLATLRGRTDLIGQLVLKSVGLPQ